MVQEDLCLMVQRDGAWYLDGAVLCFPSMWVLAEKLGHTVGDVHRPVDHYDTDLEPRVDVFFDRLRVDRPVWRRNLSLKTTPALFLPISKQGRQSALDAVGADGSPYWLRSERQTLRKLPRTGAILFGIRVQLAPIGVLRHRPDRAADLLAMIDSWDAPMRDFKAADTMDALRRWLAALDLTVLCVTADVVDDLSGDTNVRRLNWARIVSGLPVGVHQNSSEGLSDGSGTTSSRSSTTSLTAWRSARTSTSPPVVAASGANRRVALISCSISVVRPSSLMMSRRVLASPFVSTLLASITASARSSDERGSARRRRSTLAWWNATSTSTYHT